MGTHTDSWKKFRMRPKTGSKNPENTDSKYCVYNRAHIDYLYTKAWVDHLVRELDKTAL